MVPSEFRMLRETAEGIVLKLVIHSGLNHVVRKMMDQYEIEIARLRRTRVGPISLAGVSIGAMARLSGR